MSQHTKSPGSSSSSTLIVPPVPLDSGITKKDLDSELNRGSYPGWVRPDVDKRMSGKGFIEPHRNNLPRRKRRVVTAPVDGAVTARTRDKTLSHILFPTSEAGPHSPDESYLKDHLHNNGAPRHTPTPITLPRSSSSSSVNTNLTEPPSSLRGSPIPSVPFRKSPRLSEPSSTFLSYPTFQSPKRPLFHTAALATIRSLPITPTKGHLQPTSATLPRRHREQRHTAVPNDALKEVGDQMIKEVKADTDTDMVTKSKSQGMRQIPSRCYQTLAKGVILGFLTDDNDENIVQIKVYDNSLTSSSSSPRSLFPSSELHLQLSPPPNLLSHTDGTTSLTGSQIQQACTFIDEHISIQDPSKNTRPERVSVLILAPRSRPEEAMSIGISYLAGMEEIDKDKQTTEGHEAR